MLKHLLIACTLVWSTMAAAQQQPSGPNSNTPITNLDKGNGKVSGTILDSENNTPVEFANVVITLKGADRPSDGTMADDKGKFQLKNLAEGEYDVSISFIGYITQKIDNIIIKGNADLSLGLIKLEPEIKNLEEVVVEGERSLVENKIDRLVYNAEKDITNMGGNAADVLSKVPQLSLDMDGNVQLRGSGNVQILINNKPSALMSGSIADALKQIPADQIKSVEVITSPSAKYDAEGTAGIINIITKKNVLEGINGSVNSGVGTRSSNLGINLGAKKGKFGLSASTFGNAWYNRGESESRQLYASELALDQVGNNRNLGGFANGSLGIDYDLNTKNSLAAGVKWRAFGMSNTLFQESELTNQAGSLLTEYSRDIINRNFNNNLDFNFDYTHTFDKPGHDFSVLALYSRNDQDRRFSFEQYDANDATDLKQRNNNAGLNEEITIQTDYTRPMGNFTAEVGAKGILRFLSSDFRLEEMDLATNQYFFVPDRTDIFNYNQDVYSGYANGRWMNKSGWGAQFGARYEKTFIQGEFITQGASLKTDYQNFIPSATISRNFKKNNTSLKASYNQRIQRPNIWFLNPNINDADPRNISYGNPNLDPEITHSTEIGYNTFIKGTAINASLYGRFTNNAIERYTFVQGEDTLVTTFANIGRNYNYGASIYGSYKPFPKMTLSGNLNVYYVQIESNSAEISASNSGIMYNANLNASYDFGKGWKGQAFGFFNSDRIMLLGKMSAFSFYNIGFRKEFWDKKASLGLSMDNPFREALVFKTETKTNQFDMFARNAQFNRGFKLNFSYQFGKIDTRPQRPKRKKSINNDDLKGEGGGQMGGGTN